MTAKEKIAKEKIMKEARIALSENDLVTIERLMARLTPERIEAVILATIEAAVDDADGTELALAARFADRNAEIREGTKARTEATVA